MKYNKFIPQKQNQINKRVKSLVDEIFYAGYLLISVSHDHC